MQNKFEIDASEKMPKIEHICLLQENNLIILESRSRRIPRIQEKEKKTLSNFINVILNFSEGYNYNIDTKEVVGWLRNPRKP